jgi:hypothetical protein
MCPLVFKIFARQSANAVTSMRQEVTSTEVISRHISRLIGRLNTEIESKYKSYILPPLLVLGFCIFFVLNVHPFHNVPA